MSVFIESGVPTGYFAPRWRIPNFMQVLGMSLDCLRLKMGQLSIILSNLNYLRLGNVMQQGGSI